MEGKVEAIVKAEQVGNDMCQKETKEILRSQVTEVCHGYCLYVWAEALDATRVDFASELRNPKKIFFSLSFSFEEDNQTTVGGASVATSATQSTKKSAAKAFQPTEKPATLASQLAREGEKRSDDVITKATS